MDRISNRIASYVTAVYIKIYLYDFVVFLLFVAWLLRIIF